jgi:outer membrane protein OmpA-like peptidoglycan-associated protein/N-acetylneuraminic acid mutarotase
MNFTTRYAITLFFLISYFFAIAYSQEATPWSKKNTFPSGTMDKAVAFSIDEKGYAGLGFTLSTFRKDFWRYDPANDVWDLTKNIPVEPRIFAVSFSIGNKGYVGTGMTGFEGMRKGTNDFWEFNPLTQSWTQKANFGGAIRYGAVGFSILGKGYIALGVNRSVYYTDLWEYDPETNTWIKKQDFPGGGRADASVFVSGGEAYVLLGQKKELVPSQKNCWKYEPKKNEWKEIADFPGFARVGALAFAYRNKGYITCGFNGGMKRYDDLWQYDTYKDKWIQKPNVPFGPKAYIFAFVIGTNVYVGTGHGQKNTSGFDVWKYDLLLDDVSPDKFAIGATCLLGENRTPLAAMEVKLLNNKNAVIKSTTTGLFGSFLFTDLLSNEDYTVQLDVQDPHWRTEPIYLVDRKKEIIAVLSSENQFMFHVLSSLQDKAKLKVLKIENNDIRMDINGKLALGGDGNIPFSNAGISLLNDQEQTIQNTTTDQNGRFSFNYLLADTTLYLTIDENAKALLPKGTTILLMDEKGNVVNKTSSEKGEFLLVNLPPENNKLTNIYIEDSWLEATLGHFSENILLIENVYFEMGKWALGTGAKLVLNKVVIAMKKNQKITLEIAAHTDSRGDAKSNLLLSDKRANEAKKYIVSQGIEEKRIAAKGFGESKLLNKCADKIECTEEEHAKNRRMEFKVNSQ